MQAYNRRSGPGLADANRNGDACAQDKDYRPRCRYSGTAHGRSTIRSSGATTYQHGAIGSQPVRLDLQRRALSLDGDGQRELELRPATSARWNTEVQSVYRVRRSTHLNFATMVAADARYDRLTLVTDFICFNVGGTPSQFKSINVPSRLPVPVTAGLQASEGMNVNAIIWTIAGGYTLRDGD